MLDPFGGARETCLDGNEGFDLSVIAGEALGNEGVVQEGGEDVVEAGDLLGLLFAFVDQLLVLEMADDVSVVNSGDEAVGDGSDSVVDVGLGGKDVKCRLRG